MKILGIEIGAVHPEPSPRLLDQPTSAPVEKPVSAEMLRVIQTRLTNIEDLLARTISMSDKWEKHLTQSQAEKYQYVALYETTKQELAASLRINAFLEAQIASLRTRIAVLEEPKLPRMVSHKPAVTKSVETK